MLSLIKPLQILVCSYLDNLDTARVAYLADDPELGLVNRSVKESETKSRLVLLSSASVEDVRQAMFPERVKTRLTISRSGDFALSVDYSSAPTKGKLKKLEFYEYDDLKAAELDLQTRFLENRPIRDFTLKIPDDNHSWDFPGDDTDRRFNLRINSIECNLSMTKKNPGWQRFMSRYLEDFGPVELVIHLYDDVKIVNKTLEKFKNIIKLTIGHSQTKSTGSIFIPEHVKSLEFEYYLDCEVKHKLDELIITYVDVDLYLKNKKRLSDCRKLRLIDNGSLSVSDLNLVSYNMEKITIKQRDGDPLVALELGSVPVSLKTLSLPSSLSVVSIRENSIEYLILESHERIPDLWHFPKLKTLELSETFDLNCERLPFVREIILRSVFTSNLQFNCDLLLSYGNLDNIKTTAKVIAGQNFYKFNTGKQINKQTEKPS